MDRKIKLVQLNPHISCQICQGYLIDATTVTECLHTCKLPCLLSTLFMSKYTFDTKFILTSYFLFSFLFTFDSLQKLSC